MARQNLENNVTFGEQREKINDNFTELYLQDANIITYVDGEFIGKENVSNKSTTVTASNSQYPTGQAVIDYVAPFAVGSDLGLLKTTDTPPPTGTHKGDVNSAGTYTNFKDASSVAISFTAPELVDNFGYIYVVNNVATKSLVAKKTANITTNISSGQTEAAQAGATSDKINSKDANTLKIVDTGIIFKAPDAEYVGDAFYQTKGVGISQYIADETYFNQISFKFGVFANAEVICRIYTSDIEPTGGFKLSVSGTLLREVVFPGGTFPIDETTLTTLNFEKNGFNIPKNKWVIIVARATDNTAVKVRRWTTIGSPARPTIMYSTTDYLSDWSNSWLRGSVGYYAVPMILEFKIGSDLPAPVEDNTLKPRIILPSNIYSVVGTQLSLFYDAVVLGVSNGLQSLTNMSVSITCTKGALDSRCWQFTPIVGDIGTYPITINVFDSNKKLIATKASTLNVIAATAPTSVKNGVIVGDSITNNGSLVPTLRTNFVGLGSNTPVFWGSQGTAPAKHEGRPGWSFATFVGATSPFWNGTAVDISFYRNALGMGSTFFDFMTIQLGVNDSLTTARTEAQSQAIIANCKVIVDAFLADNPATKIIVALPSIDCNTTMTKDQDVYRKNLWRLRELIIENFDNGVYSANVKVGITGLGLDRYFGYQIASKVVGTRYTETIPVHTNQVHPITNGYNQMADVVFPSILNIL